jgi:phosphocarrier protein HPr
MERATLTVKNKEGLHARPASLIMQQASEFTSDVWLIVQDERVNAKSIMSLIGVSAVQHTPIIIEADGDDEIAAVATLVALFESGFGEV